MTVLIWNICPATSSSIFTSSFPFLEGIDLQYILFCSKLQYVYLLETECLSFLSGMMAVQLFFSEIGLDGLVFASQVHKWPFGVCNTIPGLLVYSSWMILVGNNHYILETPFRDFLAQSSSHHSLFLVKVAYFFLYIMNWLFTITQPLTVAVVTCGTTCVEKMVCMGRL